MIFHAMYAWVDLLSIRSQDELHHEMGMKEVSRCIQSFAEKLIEQESSCRYGTVRCQARTDLEEQDDLAVLLLDGPVLLLRRCRHACALSLAITWHRQGRASSLPQCGPACRARSPDSCL